MGEQAAAVFFPPNKWSRRFGPEFFTVRFAGWRNKDGGFDAFVLEMERGDGEGAEGDEEQEQELEQEHNGLGPQAWEVERRYSEFAALRRDLDQELPAREEHEEFPGKAFWGNRDPKHLETRQAALQAWLYGQLRQEKVLASTPMRAFLQLRRAL